MSTTVAQKEKLIKTFFALVSVLTLGVLIAIFIFLLTTGFSAFNEISLSQFFLSSDWNPVAYGEPSWGILSLIVGTLMVTLGSLIIGVPLGLGTAIYLSEVASPKVRETVKPAIEMIASIPSVVLGLIGIVFLAPIIANIFGISSGLNALTASIILGIMVMPTIISISEDVLTSIPKEFREGSYALGATKWQTIRKVLLPASLSGISAAVMLGLGRSVGETMAVLMVAGNARLLTFSFLGPVRPMTANIAIEIKEVVKGSLHYESLFAIGFVLFIMTFVVNLVSEIIITKHTRKYKW